MYINNLFQVYAPGMRKQLQWLKKQYCDIEIFISENGFIQNNPGLHDPKRIKYYKDHLEQVIMRVCFVLTSDSEIVVLTIK